MHRRLIVKICWGTLAGTAVIEQNALVGGWAACAIRGDGEKIKIARDEQT